MKVLLTGGCGYIGSHTAVTLLDNGYEVIIVDNLCNSSERVIERIEQITGKAVKLYRADVADYAALSTVFKENAIDSVIHFAGLKAVGESKQRPALYYRNNILSTVTLLECMSEFDVRSLVFSSSATVYGEENPIPYIETMRKGSCSSPYGSTKAMSETIIEDICAADAQFSAVLLRYFNPIGAHESGLIGEAPQGIPNNLMPYISQVAVGVRECLTVFGSDYPTPDGTCQRDYLHVMDLAEGHLRALEYAKQNYGCEVFNLGTGVPYSVLEIVHAFEGVNGLEIKFKLGDRREGDLPAFWADAAKAKAVLGWSADRTLEDMCRDTWNWQKLNPNGYL